MTSTSPLSSVNTSLLLQALIERFDNGLSLDKTGSANESAESLNTEVRKLAALLPRLQVALARRQNTETTINRLPIEVLAHIFKFASVPEDAHPARRIITLSLVCYHWRQTALGFPALWTTIHLREGAIHDFQLATLCLERSKDAPLSIIMSTPFRGEQISNFFSPYSSRIESVLIFVPFKCSSYDIPRLLSSTCGFPAPRLKCLRLCTAMWGSYHSPTLPVIFGGDISRVTHLQVESFSPYPGHTFGCLTHLALSSQSQFDKRPSMTEFLDFLAANPYLEELLLDDAGPSVRTSDNRPPIYLPNMRLLCFVTTSTERMLASRVLIHLRLPRQCSIRVHRDMDPSYLDDLLPSPFPEDLRLLPTFGMVEKLSLRDDIKAFGEYSVRYSVTSRQSGVSLSYPLRCPDPHDIWPEAAFTSFLRCVPCTQIRVLCLSLGKVAQTFHAEGWTSLFGRLTALEELYLTDMDVSNVVKGLLVVPRQDTEDTEFLSGLSTIYLIRPKALDIDALLSWSSGRTTREHPTDHRLTIITDTHVTSDVGFKMPKCLPKNVQIYPADSASGVVDDHTFEEPLDLTCPPFGRDN